MTVNGKKVTWKFGTVLQVHRVKALINSLDWIKGLEYPLNINLD